MTGCPLDVCAVSLAQKPFSSVMLLALNWMEVFVTFTVQRASPFFIFAVIFAVPALFAVIFPYVSTEAILLLLEENVGFFPLDVMASR